MGQTQLRVLHITTSLSVGGAENMLSKVVTSDASIRSTESSVLCLMDEGYFGAIIRKAGIKLHCLGLERGQIAFKSLFHALRVTCRHAPDVIVTWGYHADLLGCILKVFFPRAKLIWNIRCSNLDLNRYGNLTKLIVICLARLSFLTSAVIANSAAGMTVHKSMGYRSRTWKILHNGFDTKTFRPDAADKQKLVAKFKLPAHGKLLACVARFDPAKNIEGLIRAFDLASNKEDAYLLLIGPGMDTSNPALEDLLQACKFRARIIRLGMQYDMEMVYPALDGVILVSHSEGFPNVIGEAMSCGTPIVATDVGEVRYVTGELVALHDPKDTVSIGMAIASMAKLSQIERASLGAKLRQRIESHFSLQKIVEEYLVFINSVNESA